MTAIEPLAAHQTDGIALFHSQMARRLAYIDRVRAMQVALNATATQRREQANRLRVAWMGTGWNFRWATGAGKTRAALEIVHGWYAWAENLELSDSLHGILTYPILIVGEARNRHVWAAQAARWFPGTLRLATITGQDDLQAGLDAAFLGHADALVISYTGLARYVDAFEDAGMRFSLGIFDEIHRLSNPATETAQALYQLAKPQGEWMTPGIAVRLGLSATPLWNQISGLWSVLAFLNGSVMARRMPGRASPNSQRAAARAGTHYYLSSHPGLWGSRDEFEASYTYKEERTTREGRRFFVYTGTNLRHDPRQYPNCRGHAPDKCQHLHERMLRVNTHHVTREQAWPNLPPLDIQWVPVPLADEQMALYTHAVTEGFLTLQRDERAAGQPSPIQRMALMTTAFEVAASNGQLIEALQARGAGQVVLDDKPVRPVSSKLDYLAELLPDLDAPALAFTEFARFARQISEDPRLAEYRPTLLAGDYGLSPGEAERRFQGGDSRLLVSTTRGTTGLNFSRAAYAVVLGKLSYVPAMYIQAMGRMLRPDQKASRLMVYILYAPGTIEEWLMGRLADKLTVQAAAIEGRDNGTEDLGIARLGMAAFRSLFWGASGH